MLLQAVKIFELISYSSNALPTMTDANVKKIDRECCNGGGVGILCYNREIRGGHTEVSCHLSPRKKTEQLYLGVRCW